MGFDYNFMFLPHLCFVQLSLQQVVKVRSAVSLPPDPVKVHLDSWGIKKLFSLALRRAGWDKESDSLPRRKERVAVCRMSI